MKRGEYLRMFQTFRKLCRHQLEVVYQRGNVLMTKSMDQQVLIQRT